jgi:hypothetical protein
MNQYCLRLLLGCICLGAIPLSAQIDPAGAQTISYYPQFADGGPAAQRWSTTMTFVNAHVSFPAVAIANFYNDSGQPLSVDFGDGPVSSFRFTVPPQGTVRYTSRGVSPVTVTGWAVVVSSLPLQGVVQFRYTQNGISGQGVAAESTAASGLFRSPATASTGIALANPYPSSVRLLATAYDGNGSSVGNGSLSLGPLGHASLNLNQLIPGLSGSFQGSVVITGASAEYFVAWTLSSEGGVISSYPPSGANWPVSQYERIWKVWFKILNVALSKYPLGTPPDLIIDSTTTQVNAFAVPSKNEVHIFQNVAELISDSESELGFVVAHEMGHIIQARINKLAFFPTNIEIDADQYGMLLSLLAGYDPYGAAGALAKLAMASGTSGLLDQNFDNLAAIVGFDLHGSFNNRLAVIFIDMQLLCATPEAASSCGLYKGIVHPHLPPGAPLNVKPIVQ